MREESLEAYLILFLARYRMRLNSIGRRRQRLSSVLDRGARGGHRWKQAAVESPSWDMYYDIGPESCEPDLRQRSADIVCMLSGWYTGYREVIVQTDGDGATCAVTPSTVSSRAHALQH